MQINTEKCMGSSLKEHVSSLRFMNYHTPEASEVTYGKAISLYALLEHHHHSSSP